jgi:hypothetical protein
MLVMLICPVAFVPMPIPLVVVVPVFIVPVVVAVIVSQDRCRSGKERSKS